MSKRTPPSSSSPYTTRYGRCISQPSFLHGNESTESSKPAASVKPDNSETGKVGKNEKKRKVEELVEPGNDTDSDDDEEDFGQTCAGDSSDDDSDSSESTIGYCVGCDGPGPRGLMCNAAGCEDGNLIFE